MGSPSRWVAFLYLQPKVNLFALSTITYRFGILPIEEGLPACRDPSTPSWHLCEVLVFYSSTNLSFQLSFLVIRFAAAPMCATSGGASLEDVPVRALRSPPRCACTRAQKFLTDLTHGRNQLLWRLPKCMHCRQLILFVPQFGGTILFREVPTPPSR